MQNKSHDVPLSVIFVCRNHSPYVLTALNSLLEQRLSDLEILIFDVASDDDSAEKIIQWKKKYASNSFFHRYEENVGIVRVVKDAVAQARGEYLRLISTDDFFIGQSLSSQMQHLKQFGPEVALCFADAKLVDQRGKDIGLRKGLDGIDEPQLIDSFTVRRKLMSGNWIAAPTVMLRKASVVDAVNQLDESIVFEDYQLWMKLSENFDFLYLPEVVVGYRQHPGSFSSSKELASKSLDGEIQTLRRAINATPTTAMMVLRASRQIMSRSLALGSFRLIANASLLAIQGLWLGAVSSVLRLTREGVERS